MTLLRLFLGGCVIFFVYDLLLCDVGPVAVKPAVKAIFHVRILVESNEERFVFCL